MKLLSIRIGPEIFSCVYELVQLWFLLLQFAQHILQHNEQITNEYDSSRNQEHRMLNF